MISQIACVLTRIVMYFKREIHMGVEMAYLKTDNMVPDGVMPCGYAVDDHDNEECNHEVSYYAMYVDDDDDDEDF